MMAGMADSQLDIALQRLADTGPEQEPQVPAARFSSAF